MKVLDNFLTEEEYNIVNDLRFRSGYRLESDGYPEDNPINTGMSLDISKDDEIYKIFSQKLFNIFEEVKSLNIYRMYINCFAPLEWPYFHTDIDSPYNGITCLYYLNNYWDLNDGGETQFFVDNSIIAIPPIPNRVVCFDSRLLHKATSFRNKQRFSIAVKYQ
jgi:Rps23 Pro-64 3,4-dihydroxylase Tpa1-like proline 4-hydroxylase